MIMGTGIDLTEVERIKKALENTAFAAKVFTIAEQQYCWAQKAHAAESFAARFAAKEALLKAFGTGLRNCRLTEIETLNNVLGKPKICLHGAALAHATAMGIKKIHLSLSHTQQLAIAQIVLEGSDDESCFCKSDV